MKVLKYLAVALLGAALIPAGYAGAAKTGLIGSSDVANNSLRSADVKNNTLRSKDVADGTLRCKDLKRTLRKALADCVQPSQGDRGQRGDQGPTGGTGNPGATGPPGDDAQTIIAAFPAPGFDVTNGSCSLTPAGVECGPYGDGGSEGGSLFYSGANGLRLDQIAQLSYTEQHASDNDSPIAAPYLRIFLEGDAHDVIFDATECAAVVPTEGELNSYEVTTSDVRYDDDSCDGVPPDQQSWEDVVAAHGSEVVSGIYITTGFTGGTNLESLVADLRVNGERFVFEG